MQYEIIDFHTHPFTDDATNICAHKEYCNMSAENTVSYLKSLGISKICGSVICRNIGNTVLYANNWEMIADSNVRCLALWEKYGDFYVPGFHVHPDYVKESCDEIEKMHKLGFNIESANWFPTCTVGVIIPVKHLTKFWMLPHNIIVS